MHDLLRRTLPAGGGAVLTAGLVAWWLAAWRTHLTGDGHGLAPGSLALLALAIGLQALALQLALARTRRRACSKATGLWLASGLPLHGAIVAEPAVLAGFIAASLALVAIAGTQLWSRGGEADPWRLLALAALALFSPLVMAAALILVTTLVP